MNKQRIISCLIIISMTIGLLAGIGTIFNKKETETVLAAAPVCDRNGIFAEIPSKGELGTKNNPFVVLEIVPNEKMASFGYLVGGQEPIDVPNSEMVSDKNSEMASVLDMYFDEKSSVSENGEGVLTEFDSVRSETENSESYLWKENGEAERFGDFIRTDKKDGSHDITGVLKYHESENGNYVRSENYTEDSENGEYVFLIPCTEGEGTYSSGNYIFTKLWNDGLQEIRTLNSSEKDNVYYSITYQNHKGEGNGNYSLNEINSYYFETDITIDRNMESLQNWSLKPEFVLFRRYTDADSGKQRYSIKGETSVKDKNYYYKQNKKNINYTKYYTGGYSQILLFWNYEEPELSANGKGSCIAVFEKDDNGGWVVYSEAKSNKRSNADAPYTYNKIDYYTAVINQSSGGELDLFSSFIPQPVSNYYGKISGTWYTAGNYSRTESDNFADIYGNNIIKDTEIEWKNIKNRLSGMPAGDSLKVGKRNYAEWSANDRFDNPYQEYLAFSAGDKTAREIIKIKLEKGLGNYSLTSGYREAEEYEKKDASIQKFEAYYLMSFELNHEGRGDYKLEAYNYTKSLEIRNSIDADDPSVSSSAGFEMSVKDYEEGKFPDSFRMLIGIYPVSTAHEIGVKNTELFKKYGIGLLYKNGDHKQGFDASAYHFDGWYYEKECVNKFNLDAPLTSDIILYAKWIQEYETEYGYDIHFKYNCVPDNITPDDKTTAETYDFLTISKAAKGAALAAPATVPVRKGYVFDGWYLDKECKNKISFSSFRVSSETDIYAKWKSLVTSDGTSLLENTKEYNISFDKGVKLEKSYEVSNMPGTVEGVLENCCTGNLKGETFISAKPSETVPERPGYIFTGWYADRECRYRFDFNAPLTREESDITLYAGWLAEELAADVSITFDTNRPSDAAAEPVLANNVIRGIGYNEAPSKDDKYIPISFVPSLEGNIEQKIRDYRVKVVTITPSDLNKQENEHLISRANMIVISGVKNNDYVSYFNAGHNKTLFPKDSYDSSCYNYLDGNDISFRVVRKILNRIAGTEGNSICPVIFDYNIFNTAYDAGQKKTFSSRFSDGSTFTSVSEKGSSNNLYKLYLLTQQLNPVTAYNVYLNSGNDRKEIYIDENGDFINGIETGDGKKFWHKYTLIPYQILTKSEWDSNSDNAKRITGINPDYKLSDDFSRISNRVFVFNTRNAATNTYRTIAELFTAKDALSGVGNEELNKFYGTVNAFFKPYEGIFFMLNDSVPNINYKNRIEILEIQPWDSFRDDSSSKEKGKSFWFWHLSRYIPNFDGSYHVTSMSSSEFIGSLDDLNAKYDIVYIGSNTNGQITSIMPKTAASTSVRKNTETVIEVAQTINQPFYKYEYVVRGGEVSPSRVNNDGSYLWVEPHPVSLKYENGTVKIDESSLIESDKLLNFTVSTTGGPYDEDRTDPNNSNNTTYYRILSSKTKKGNSYIYSYKYYNEIAVSAKIKNTTVPCNFEFDFFNNENGPLWKWYSNLFGYSSGKYYIPAYYYRAGSAGNEWILHNSGEVSPGDRIKLADNGTILTQSGNVFAYAHTGEQFGNLGLSKRGSFSGNGNDDGIQKTVFSGNDITRQKLNELRTFVQAGYPVITASNLYNGNDVNTALVDNTSYIYDFLTELKTDYSSCCFPENDYSHDNEFIKALNSKSFSLMLQGPADYINNGDDSNPKYINPNEDDEKVLEFSFTINGPATGNYKVEVYIDTNADGKFDEQEEKLDSLDIYDRTSRRTVRYNRLTGGHSYSLSRQIEDYAGAIPWKLVVTSPESDLIKVEEQGICAVKVFTGKKKINILQIMPVDRSDFKTTVMFPIASDIRTATNYGSVSINSSNKDTFFSGMFNGALDASNVRRNAGKFYYYTSNLNDFDVEFFRMDVNQFIYFANGGDPMVSLGNHGVFLDGQKIMCKSKTNMDDWSYDVLEDEEISMLVLGYADCYSDINDTAAVELIRNFINQGKSVLFTHDTTSFINVESSEDKVSGDTNWGYHINRAFRDELGMDRYGVMTNKGDISLIEANPDKYFDLPYQAGSANALNPDGLLIKSPNTYNDKNRALIQGFTDTFLKTKERVSGVTRSNSGQITSYPYTIPETFEVARTHSQYYQLNLEADDITVWYCLNGLDGSDDVFYKRKNDVRNNYYIYNRGNITYSGVGHSGGLTDTEAKLFVNTMIAAYMSTALPTKPVIINRDKSTADSTTDYLYVDYDMADAESEAAKQAFGDEIFYNSGNIRTFGGADSGLSYSGYGKRIFFILKNYSILRNKEMIVRYYPVLVNKNTGEETEFKDLSMYLPTYKIISGSDEALEASLCPERLLMFKYQRNDGAGKRTVSENRYGSIADANYEYYVDIPIYDEYYRSLYEAYHGPVNWDNEASLTDEQRKLKSYALDSNNSFEVRIEVTLCYGKKLVDGSGNEYSDNSPLIGYRNTVVMRRGMFTLD